MTTLTLSPVGRRALPPERPPHSTFAVAALGLAVLAAVAIAIALAIPNLPDIGTIYVTVTISTDLGAGFRLVGKESSND
jgi:hypothetical protein